MASCALSNNMWLIGLVLVAAYFLLDEKSPDNKLQMLSKLN